MTDFAARLKAERAKLALEKELAKARKASSPSMNTWTPRKPKVEDPPPPSIEELDLDPADTAKLKRIVDQHASITKTQGLLKKRKGTLTEEIKPLCKLYGLDKFMVGENRAVFYSTERTSISRDLLLQCGVSPEIIRKCTVIKHIDQFKTTGPKENSNGEDDTFD